VSINNILENGKMLQIKMVSRSEHDTKPTINTNDLIKAGFLKSKPSDGSVVELKLVNSGGIVAVQDFVASRNGSTLYAKNGFNDYLFGLPSVGNPIHVGCVGLAKRISSTYTAPSSIKELKALLNGFPTKKAAAEAIGLSTDSLRRLEKKIIANAASKGAKVSVSSNATPTAKASTSKKTPEKIYGKFKLSKTQISNALKISFSKSDAASFLAVSTDTLRRAMKFFNI
jgi:hypothetical protein